MINLERMQYRFIHMFPHWWNKLLIMHQREYASKLLTLSIVNECNKDAWI